MNPFLRHARETAKTKMIGTLLGLLGQRSVQRLVRERMGHVGLILMIHHVAPPGANRLTVNKGLEITPETLDYALRSLKAQDYDLVPMDAVPERIAAGSNARRRFAAITFDDGARDNFRHAAPVLLRHNAPFTIFVTTGFAARSAAPWWHVIERAAIGAKSLTIDAEDGMKAFDTSDRAKKERAALALHDIFWRANETTRVRLTTDLAKQSGLDPRILTSELYLNWSELSEIAALPGCSIGAHTMTHATLADLDESAAMQEIWEARDVIRERLKINARHFAYPYGAADCCGEREFELVRKAGYATAVTTRRGTLQRSNIDSLTSLPRVPVNGHYQRPPMIDALTSGLPMALAVRVNRHARRA